MCGVGLSASWMSIALTRFRSFHWWCSPVVRMCQRPISRKRSGPASKLFSIELNPKMFDFSRSRRKGGVAAPSSATVLTTGVASHSHKSISAYMANRPSSCQSCWPPPGRPQLATAFSQPRARWKDRLRGVTRLNLPLRRSPSHRWLYQNLCNLYCSLPFNITKYILISKTFNLVSFLFSWPSRGVY